ncbi:hypothetical protein F4779DRAFT_583250 [Xylariaceae sp. FL0662B]|nr:hypothetical protein F4779DRAFT_583250 [Xylariaceae sp. FL0662B]
MDRALGIDVANDAASNVAAMERYFDPGHPEHARVRRAVEDAQTILDAEFHAIGAEVGWFYPAEKTTAAAADRGSHAGPENDPEEEVSDHLLNNRPSTVPGRQLPHAWLRRGDGATAERVSTRDMVVRDKFLLLARSADWRALDGPYVHVEVIGPGSDAAWTDAHGTWAETCGVGEVGAVLARPDRIVGWRARRLDEDVLAGWDGTIARLLRVSHL